MEQKRRKRFLIIISILIGLICLDLVLPHKSSQNQKLDEFKITTLRFGFGTGKTRGSENQLVMCLENQETYKIGKIPNITYPKGQSLIVHKSFLFGKVNFITILETTPKKISIGQFSNPYHLSLLVFVITVFVLNLFFRNNFLEILLFLSLIIIVFQMFFYIAYY